MKTVFLLLLLLIPLHAQRPVEPIRLALSTEAGGGVDERQLNRLVSGELRRFRDVVFSSRGADFEVYVVAMPVSENSQCRGFVAVLLVIDRSSGRSKLSIETGPDLQGMAGRMASRIDREFFQARRSAR